MPKYTNRLKHTSHYENVAEGWVLTDIGELLINRDSERVPLSLGVRSKQENKIYDYYGATGVVDKVDDYLFDERLLLIGEDGANLLSRSKDNAFFAEGKYWVNNHAHILDCPEKEVLDYVAFLINSMSLEDYITGSAQPKLNQDNLNKIEIPLPPLEEQRRIIAQVNLWQNYIQDLEASEIELKESVESAKSKILDLAIHGKLVPQDANDEPASELLKRINPKAVTSCDNPHYEQVPDGWCVCTLEDIVDYEQPQAYIVHSTDYSDSYKIPVLTAGKSFIIGYTNEQDGICDNVPVIIFDDFTTDNKYVDFPFKVKSSAMKILHVNDGINIKYVAYFMSITRLIGDTHKRYWISEYSKVNIPLPPKAEQDRIVTQIERLMCSLDFIAETLV